MLQMKVSEAGYRTTAVRVHNRLKLTDMFRSSQLQRTKFWQQTFPDTLESPLEVTQGHQFCQQSIAPL